MSSEGWGWVSLGDVAKDWKATWKPENSGAETVDHYSIPAFDAGRVPSQERPADIKSNKRIVASDSILLSRLNPTTPRVWAPRLRTGRESVCSTEMMVLRPNEGLDRGFLHYLCRSPFVASGMLQRVSGTTGSHQRVSPNDVLSLVVPVPQMLEQRAIAEVLGALDERIEWCASLQNALHQLGATALEEALASEGMSASRPLARSKTIALGELLEALESGSRPKGGVGGIQSGIPSVGAESIERAGYFDYGKTRYVSQEFFGQMRRGHVQDFDVLVYKDGGRPGEFIPHVSMAGSGHPFGEFAINDHVYRVRVRHPYSQSVLYFWLRTPQSTEEMAMRGTGAAQPGLNQANFRDVPLPLLSEARLRALDAELSALLRLVLHLGVEQRKLSELRDSLLPKLVSGEVRIPDPQALLEPVG